MINLKGVEKILRGGKLHTIKEKFKETLFGRVQEIHPKQDIGLHTKILHQIIEINPDSSTSFHYHTNKVQIVTVMRGSGMLLTSEYSVLEEGTTVAFLPKQIHRIWAGSSGLTLQVVSVGKDLSEADKTDIG